MSERRRLHREDPERREPIRNWEATRRAAEAWRGVGRDGPEPGAEDPFGDRPGGAPHPRHHPEDPGRFEAGRGHPHDSDRRPSDDRWPGDPTWQDMAADGVHMGYRVIEEHIREGQRAARQFRDRQFRDHRDHQFRDHHRPDTPPAPSDNLWQLFQQALRYSEDLTAFWYQLLGSFARPPAPPYNGPGGWGSAWNTPRPEDHRPRHPPYRAAEPWGGEAPWNEGHENRYEDRQPRSHGPGAPWHAQGRFSGNGFPGNGNAAPFAMSIEVDARRPVQVSFDLPPELAGRSLDVFELSAAEEGRPPLTEVFIAVHRERHHLRIRIPENHPGGLYVGRVIDRESGAPCGELSVYFDEWETAADSEDVQ